MRTVDRIMRVTQTMREKMAANCSRGGLVLPSLARLDVLGKRKRETRCHLHNSGFYARAAPKTIMAPHFWPKKE